MPRFRTSLLSFGAGAALVTTILAAVKATLVRDVDHAANYPFIGGVDTFGSTTPVPTQTPDGKPVRRAVIEYVSGSCNAQLPNTIYEVSLGVTLITGPGSSQNAHYAFVPVHTTTAGDTNALYVVSQTVRLYADPGTDLTIGLGTNSGGGDGTGLKYCSLVFSGHLVTE
jgi:hypothetical protein